MAKILDVVMLLCTSHFLCTFRLPCRAAVCSSHAHRLSSAPYPPSRCVYHIILRREQHTIQASCGAMTSCDSEHAFRIARNRCRRHQTTRIAGRWLRRRFLPTCASARHGRGRCCRALSAASWESYRAQQATGEQVSTCVGVGVGGVCPTMTVL